MEDEFKKMDASLKVKRDVGFIVKADFNNIGFIVVHDEYNYDHKYHSRYKEELL